MEWGSACEVWAASLLFTSFQQTQDAMEVWTSSLCEWIKILKGKKKETEAPSTSISLGGNGFGLFCVIARSSQEELFLALLDVDTCIKLWELLHRKKNHLSPSSRVLDRDPYWAMIERRWLALSRGPRAWYLNWSWPSNRRWRRDGGLFVLCDSIKSKQPSVIETIRSTPVGKQMMESFTTPDNRNRVWMLSVERFNENTKCLSWFARALSSLAGTGLARRWATGWGDTRGIEISQSNLLTICSEAVSWFEGWFTQNFLKQDEREERSSGERWSSPTRCSVSHYLFLSR